MMRVFYSLKGVPDSFGPSVAVIGNFDGVHRGHAQVLDAVIAEARQKRLYCDCDYFRSAS